MVKMACLSVQIWDCMLVISVFLLCQIPNFFADFPCISEVFVPVYFVSPHLDLALCLNQFSIFAYCA